jgi:hypothetical protein
MFVIKKLIKKQKTEKQPVCLQAEKQKLGQSFSSLLKLKILNLKPLKLIVVSLITIGFSTLFLGTAQAATFNMDPSVQVFERGCTRTLTLLINATGESSNAAEVEINYDPAQIQIIDSNSGASGIQVETGDAYEAYVFNEVDTLNGTIKVAGLSFIQNLNSQKVFARINFQSTLAASATQFDIRFDGVGDTFDSNIADSNTNLDLLTSVTDGNYTFVNGVCNADTVGPGITFISPQNNQTGVSGSSNLIVRLTDNSSGIDLNTVEFIVNGQLYRPSSPEVSYVGNSLDYTFTINPTDFPENQASTVVVRADDNSGNSSNRQIIFNMPVTTTPPSDSTSPTVVFVYPINQQVGVENGDQFEINILDDESGIVTNSIEVYLNGELIPLEDITVSGTEQNYLLNFTVNSIIPGKVNYLRITGQDADGNTFDRQIVFNESVPEPLECPVNPPTNTNNGNNSCTINQGVTNVINKIFEGTVLENISVNTITTAGSMLVLLLSLIPIFNILSIGALGFRAIGFIFGKRNSNPWGLVIDAHSGKPIAFAICELYVEGAQYKLTQTVSDLDGRYGFIVPAGNYRLEIKQSGYVHYKKDIRISAEQESIINDAHLIPVNLVDTHIKKGIDLNLIPRIKFLLNNASKYLFAFGLVFSIFALVILQNTVNILIFVFYLLTFIAWIIMKILNNKKRYGQVINSGNKLRIPFAQVKIFDPKTWKLIDSQITNYNGLFDFYGKPGKYAILVAARGYRFPSSENTYKIINDKFGGLLSVELKKGKNNISLFMDSGDSTNMADGTMKSPFS